MLTVTLGKAKELKKHWRDKKTYCEYWYVRCIDESRAWYRMQTRSDWTPPPSIWERPKLHQDFIDNPSIPAPIGQEIRDELPDHIFVDWFVYQLHIWKNRNWECICCYRWSDELNRPTYVIKLINKPLAQALADLRIRCEKNNYLS